MDLVRSERRELRQITRNVKKESFIRSYGGEKGDPLLTPILGPATITWHPGDKVTVTFGEKKFAELTNVPFLKAEHYLSGMCMGIAVKYDHDFAKWKAEYQQQKELKSDDSY